MRAHGFLTTMQNPNAGPTLATRGGGLEQHPHARAGLYTCMYLRMYCMHVCKCARKYVLTERERKRARRGNRRALKEVKPDHGSSIFLKTGWRSSGRPPIFCEILSIKVSSSSEQFADITNECCRNAYLCSQNLVLHGPGNTSWQPPYHSS